MRFMLKVNIPVEDGNEAVRKGTLGKTISDILSDIKPEAVYFGDENGMRTGFIFFEMNDSSEIPKIAEPWMLAFNAEIEIHPVMRPEDLEKAASHIQNAAEKY